VDATAKRNYLPAPRENSGQQHHPFAIDSMFLLRVPTDPQLAPDGRQVAFVLSEWVPDQPKPRGRIWMVEAAGGEPRPFSNGPNGDSSPTWSPDGHRLAFVSKRDEADKDATQLYIMPAEGGEARRVCVMPNGASDAAWSPDGARIAFLSLEGAPPKAGPKVNEELRHQRLWTVRPESDTPEPVTPPDLTVWSFAWSPDGKQLAVFYSTGPSETDWYRGQIGIVPAGGGAVRQLTQLTRQAAALTWSRDGQRLAFICGEWSDRPLIGGDVYVIPVADGEPRNLTPGIECSPSWLQWLPDDTRLLYAAWDGLTNAFGILSTADGSRTALERDFIIGDGAWPHASATGDSTRLAVTHSDQQHPSDVWLGEMSEAGSDAGIIWRQLTRLNPLLEETVALAPSERIAYEGADGWRIEALYTSPLTPTSEPEGSAPPLVALVHGGPTSAYRDGWGDTWAQLFASAGYAVLRPNIRGSIGRGIAFADAVLTDPGGKDFQDVMAGVDYLIAQGKADAKRLAVVGWSYGGFMVAWTVTQTTRFKAAIVGAGICDFHSFHAQTNIADWDMRILGGEPPEHPELYRERSAITHAKRITTPTLIVHGEDDPCVPVNQAYAFYRALRERAIPTELAVYPREGHGFRERDHLRDLYERWLRWLKAYV
jgi:dipeptidyl aminopeptidase/acylaminoacyl peptidase